MNNCFHRVWIWRVVEGTCHLHFSQAVQGEEGMSLDLCDAVALRNLTVPQRNVSTSINRLTKEDEQITLKKPVNLGILTLGSTQVIVMDFLALPAHFL